jgi:hypothetical protein
MIFPFIRFRCPLRIRLFSLMGYSAAEGGRPSKGRRFLCDQLFRTRFAPFVLILYAGRLWRHVPQPEMG